MYSSLDLNEWKYEGIILAANNDENSPLCGLLRFERPKIIYNDKTKKYVLWCHCIKCPGDHSFGEGGGEAGVAVSDKMTGPYRFLGTIRPINNEGMVRDCTLYKDDDGTAYFIYDRDETFDLATRCIHAVKLTDDCLAPTDEHVRIGTAYRLEAPAVIKHGSYYYMITSDMTAGEASKAKYFRAASILGEWEDMGDPYLNDELGNSFISQTTYAFKIDWRGEYVHMAERHNKENFLHRSYVWLSISLDREGKLSIEYLEEYEIN